MIKFIKIVVGWAVVERSRNTAHEGFQAMYNCPKSRFRMMSNHIDARWWAVPTLPYPAEVLSLELRIDNQSNTIDLSAETAHVQAEQTAPAWLKSAGIFKADPQFEAFQEEIQSYRNELDALNI